MAAIDRALETYRFDLYANAIYDFAWHEFCDWYVELAKPLLSEPDADPAAAQAARRTLFHVLDALLRAAHPLMPYLTEILWRELNAATLDRADSVMLAPFPSAAEYPEDREATAAIEWLKALVVAVRNIRGELGVAPRTGVDVLLRGGTGVERERLAAVAVPLRRLAGIDDIAWLDDAPAPPAAMQLAGGLEVLVPLEGLIDAHRERERLTKEMEKLAQVLGRCEAKLGNANFVAKAPPEVVQGERAKVQELTGKVAALKARIALLGEAQG